MTVAIVTYLQSSELSAASDLEQKSTAFLLSRTRHKGAVASASASQLLCMLGSCIVCRGDCCMESESQYPIMSQPAAHPCSSVPIMHDHAAADITCAGAGGAQPVIHEHVRLRQQQEQLPKVRKAHASLSLLPTAHACWLQRMLQQRLHCLFW